VPEPHCRVAGRVDCHEERCTDQPERDLWILYPYHISNMGRMTGRELTVYGVEDIGASCCADAGYDMVVLLRRSVGFIHI
jgi:hypothetical protein